MKWIEDRREHFLTATQERDQWWTIEVAFENDGCIRGVRLEMVHDNGAWLPWGIIMPWISVTTTPGPYVIPAMSVDLQVVFTNKGPTSPVRGAGRPQAVFAMERILDRGAHRLGIDRAELRKRNFIQPKQMPYEVGFIYRDGKPMRYDSGDYPQTQAAALERADYAGFTVRQRKARAEADSSASDWPTMSKALASGHSKGRPFGSSRTAESPCSPAHRRRARATRRPLHRFVQTSSVCLST